MRQNTGIAKLSAHTIRPGKRLENSEFDAGKIVEV
jgi:hypothetical protein